MTRCLLLLSLFFPLHAMSGSIEIAQWVPWGFVQKHYLSQRFQESLSHRTEVMSLGELRPRLTYSGTFSGSLRNLSFAGGNISALHELSAELEVSGISVDQVLRREMNGNIFEVRLKAECSPFTVQITELLAASRIIFLEAGSLYEPVLAEMKISPSTWTISSLQCSGIGNLGDEIKRQLEEALRSPALLEEALKNFLAEKIREIFYSSWANLGQGLSVSGMEKPNNQGVMIYARMAIKKNIQQNFKRSPVPDRSDVPQLLLSQEGFQLLLEDKIGEFIPSNYNLQKAQGFSDLMKSRFKQYLVWPDLRRFSSQSPFFFSPHGEAHLTLLPKRQGVYSVAYRTNAKLEAVIGGAKIDYVLIGAGAGTELTIAVEEGLLKLSTGKEAELSLAWEYGYLYQLLYRPDKRIAIDLLKSALAIFFKNQKTFQELPTIRLPGRILKLNGFREHNGVISMDWL